MSGGRPRLPSNVHRLHGTDRADRMNPNEPVLPIGTPDMPAGLSTAAKKQWKAIVPLLEEMQVLTAVDGTALLLLCEALAEFAQADTALRKAKSLTYESEGRNGVRISARPEVGIRADAWRRAHRMLADFGMTPSARTRVSALATGQDMDPMEALVRGNSRTA